MKAFTCIAIHRALTAAALGGLISLTSGLTVASSALAQAAGTPALVSTDAFLKKFCGTSDAGNRVALDDAALKDLVSEKLTTGLSPVQVEEVRALARLFSVEVISDDAEKNHACFAQLTARVGADLLAFEVNASQPQLETHSIRYTVVYELRDGHVAPAPLGYFQGAATERADLTGDGVDEWISVTSDSFAVFGFDRAPGQFRELGAQRTYEDSSVNLGQCPYEEFSYRIDKAAKPFPVVVLSSYLMKVPVQGGCTTEGTHEETRFQWDPAKKALAKIAEQQVPDASKGLGARIGKNAFAALVHFFGFGIGGTLGGLILAGILHLFRFRFAFANLKRTLLALPIVLVVEYAACLYAVDQNFLNGSLPAKAMSALLFLLFIAIPLLLLARKPK